MNQFLCFFRCIHFSTLLSTLLSVYCPNNVSASTISSACTRHEREKRM